MHLKSILKSCRKRCNYIYFSYSFSNSFDKPENKMNTVYTFKYIMFYFIGTTFMVGYLEIIYLYAIIHASCHIPALLRAMVISMIIVNHGDTYKEHTQGPTQGMK